MNRPLSALAALLFAASLGSIGSAQTMAPSTPAMMGTAKPMMMGSAKPMMMSSSKPMMMASSKPKMMATPKAMAMKCPKGSTPVKGYTTKKGTKVAATCRKSKM